MKNFFIILLAIIGISISASAQRPVFGPISVASLGSGIITTNTPVSGQTLFSGGGSIYYWDWATNSPATNIVLTGTVFKNAGSTAAFIANAGIYSTNFSVEAVNYISNLTYQVILTAAFANDTIVSNGLITYVGNSTNLAYVYSRTIGAAGTNDVIGRFISPTNLATTVHQGFVPTLANDATKFFDSTGNYSVPTGSGGAATNAIANVYSNNVSQVTGATSLDFWNGANLSIGPVTNRTGHVDVPFSLSSSLTGMVSVAGSGSTLQFGGAPAGSMFSMSNNAVSGGAVLTVDTNANIYPAQVVCYASATGLTNNSGLNPSSPWPMPYALTRVGGGILNLMDSGALTNHYFDITSKNNGMTLQPYRYPQIKWTPLMVCTDNPTIFIEPGVVNVTIQGLQVAYNSFGQDGIKAQGVTNLTIRDCWSHDNQGNGILAQDNFGSIFERNICVNNGSGNTNVSLVNHLHGIYAGGTNLTIRGNVLFDNTNGYGLTIYGNAIPSNNVNCVVYENLFYKNSRGVNIAQQAGCTNYYFNNTCVSNINTAEQFYGGGTGTIYATNNISLNNGNGSLTFSGGNLIEDYNIVESAVSSPGTHDVVNTSPGFVNGNAGLYWLTASSVARGIAVNVSLAVDFFGNPLSTNADVGAFQYAPNWKSFDTRKLYQSTWPDYWIVRSGSGITTASAGSGITITPSINPDGSTNYSVAATGGGSQTPLIQDVNAAKFQITNLLSLTVGNDPQNGETIITGNGTATYSTNYGVWFVKDQNSNVVALVTGSGYQTNGQFLLRLAQYMPTNGINLGGTIDPGAGNLIVSNNIAAMQLVIGTNGVASYRSNSIAPVAFTFPATTVNWTNPINCSIELYIDNSGVTGTVIKKNGGQIASSLVGDAIFGLQPGEYFSETYSVGTPVGKWSPIP